MSKIRFDFTSEQFDIERYLSDLQDHSHRWPAAIDHFCNILKGRCTILEPDRGFILIEQTGSENFYDNFRDAIEPYILISFHHIFYLEGQVRYCMEIENGEGKGIFV